MTPASGDTLTWHDLHPVTPLPSPPQQHQHPLPTLSPNPGVPLPVPVPVPAHTGGTRARPRSAGRPWVGSRRGRCCGSARRSAAGAGARRASWPCAPSWRGSSPRPRSTACAAAGPRCTPSPAPAAHAAAGRRRLRSRRLLRDRRTPRSSAGTGRVPSTGRADQPGGPVPSPSAGHSPSLQPRHLQPQCPSPSAPAPWLTAPVLTAPLSAAPAPTDPTACSPYCPQPPFPAAPQSRCRSLSEQMTPAAKRVPVFLQLTLVPWCWQWLRDISCPAHFTPLSTISVTLLASQYHVSWGGAGGLGWLPWLPHITAHPPAQPCPRTPAAPRPEGPVLPHTAPPLLGKHRCLCSPGCHRGLPAGTYRHRMQGVAQAKLATGHHGLLGGPAIAAHRAPLTASLHLHTALERRPPAGQADLQKPWGREPAPRTPPRPGPSPVPSLSRSLPHPRPGSCPIHVPVPAEQSWWRLAALTKLALAPTCKPWLAKPSPSWRQATMASSVPQPSPQTRPQRGWSPSAAPTATSTRPSKRLRPPLSRICGERRQQHHRQLTRSPCGAASRGRSCPAPSRSRAALVADQNCWVWGQEITCELGNCLTKAGKAVHFEMAVSFQK